MHHRGFLPQNERLARSRLTKLFTKSFLIGQPRLYAPTLWQATCKCTQGELHHSFYLALKVDAKRKMIHIPQSLEPQVRQWVPYLSAGLATHGTDFQELLGALL